MLAGYSGISVRIKRSLVFLNLLELENNDNVNDFQS